MMKKVLVAIVGILILGFFWFDLDGLLTLGALKAGLSDFEVWRDTQPAFVGGSFFLVYVLVAALSLPGAAILTIAAGALFGLAWGTLIVSFASSLGATLAFLVSRYLLRDSVQKSLGDRLKAIDEGVAKDGAFYLFTLRLVPVFPFFLINLLMGLTSIKAATFYWVSQAAMLLGTAIYVNAGTQVAQLESLAGILSPGLILSFVLLGVFPLLAKKIVSKIQAKKVYAGHTKPEQFDRNLIVIGAGAGGLVSSYIAAAVKAKVTLIEAHKMGGDCLNFGCVPSKALIKSAKIAHQIQHADRYGLEGAKPVMSFKNIMARVHEVIRKIEPHDSVERYEKLGVEVLQGYGRLIDPWTVEVKLNSGALQRLTAKSIVIAAGARPFIPPLPGIEDVGYATSDTLWDSFAKLEEVPKRLAVLGGGPIGCELAQSFARLGSAVTQIEMGPRLMAREDVEVSEFVQNTLESNGVRVLVGHKALRCERNQHTKQLVVEHEGQEVTVEFDYLLCAVGRTARLEGYGLDTLGIPVGRTIETNEFLQTKFPNIYAVGDVAGPYQFTHTAAHQAWFAAVNSLFGGFKQFKVDYRVIPWTTFVDPEVARVGLNETEATNQNIPYEVTRYGLDDLDRAITESADEGFIKVLTVPGKDKILGVTIVGQHGGEILTEFVLAMKHGLGLNKILGTIHAYPTWAEGNKYAAGEWKRANVQSRVLSWLEKYHTWQRKDAKDRSVAIELRGEFK